MVAERALLSLRLVVGRRLAAVAGEAEFLRLPRAVAGGAARAGAVGGAGGAERACGVRGCDGVGAARCGVAVGEVLGVVRMALLPLEYLAETVGADPLVTESFEALRIFAEASRYSRLKGAARASAESDGRLCKRKHASGGELGVVGGYDGIFLRWAASASART